MRVLLLAALFLQVTGSPPDTTTWAISGRILSPDGNPATKVTVGAFRAGDPLPGPDSPVLASADTDADGKYRLRGLPAGKYRVMAGILDQATYFPGVLEASEGNIVVLTGTADLDNIDFPLIRSATLEIDGRTITEVVKKFEVSHANRETLTKILTALRTRLNLRYLIGAANAITLRDTPGRVALAGRLIVDFDNSSVVQASGSPAPGPRTSNNPFLYGVGFDAARNVFLLEPDAFREMNPSRSQLRTNGPFSLKIKGDTRTAFEAIAEKADINVAFDPRVDTGSVREFVFDSADVRIALDLLSRRTSTYWQTIDSRTILVAPDTASAHQTMDHQVLRTFYLTNAEGVGLTEIVVTLRTLLNLRYVAAAPYLFAVSIRDTPAMVAVAEKIIADMDVASGPAAPGAAAKPTTMTPRVPLPPSETVTMNVFGNLIQAESNGLRNVTPGRDQLEPKSKGPVSVQMTKDGRSAFQTLADLAGIAVQFDPSFTAGQAVRFHLKDADIPDALDLLALQTRSFWQVSDSHTILVTSDTPENRLRLLPKTQATFSLTHVKEEAAMNIILNAIRTLLNVKEIELIAGSRSLVLTDTPNMIALAQKVVADLDRPNR